MLASIKLDTSRIDEKLSLLFKMLPDHLPNEFLSMISSLTNDIVLVDNATTVVAGGTFNIVYVFDFSFAAYSEVLAAAGAFKADIAHQ